MSLPLPMPGLTASQKTGACSTYEFLDNGGDCRPCPSGAVCNGTEHVAAAIDYWRTGYYADNGTYYPNTNEYRFIRSSFLCPFCHLLALHLHRHLFYFLFTRTHVCMSGRVADNQLRK